MFPRVWLATEGRAADAVFEHVGEAKWDESNRSLSRLGRFVTCGAFTGSKVMVNLWPLFSKQLKLIGSFSAIQADYKKVLTLTSQGALKDLFFMLSCP
jgi:NADPH:quinone reductase-like Zn-dependent oxidoreductase